jgi:salicylate hydroxylase
VRSATTDRVVIAGGGIGGLATAIALGRAGVPSVVLERDRVLSSSGGGIQLSPNATAVLRRLGLGAALDGAFRPAGRELRRWSDGTPISRVTLGREADRRYGDPYVTLRRSTLRRVLYDAATSVADVRLGRPAVSISPRGARLSIGSEPADLLIGADGLNSLVRRSLVADQLRFSGYVAYRAVLPAELFSTVDVVVWLGPRQHCVCYPIDGGRSLNLVAMLPAVTPPPPARGVRGEELLAAYAEWDPTVRGLLAAARGFDRHPLFDRPSAGPRCGRRIALLGDAALPMLPFLAQGAGQALEDAEALARNLTAEAGGPSPDFDSRRKMEIVGGAVDNAFPVDSDLTTKLAAYAAERSERAERVAAASRAGARDHHLPDGPGQRRRDRRLAGLTLTDLDWLYTPRGDHAPPGRVPA